MSEHPMRVREFLDELFDHTPFGLTIWEGMMETLVERVREAGEPPEMAEAMLATARDRARAEHFQ